MDEDEIKLVMVAPLGDLVCFIMLIMMPSLKKRKNSTKRKLNTNNSTISHTFPCIVICTERREAVKNHLADFFR